MKPITYPARPINGGPFDKARPKAGGPWYYEPKYNGWRTLVHIATGTMFNRLGEVLTITKEFDEALGLLRTTLDAEAFKWADCEGLQRRHDIGKGTLIVLDVVPEPTWASATYLERRAWLKILWQCFPSNKPEDGTIYRVAQIGPDYAAEYWRRLQEINQVWACDFFEGLVAKRADSIYPIQLRSPDEAFAGWIKHRWQF